MTKEKIASILLGIKAVTISPSMPFTWASGIKAPIYCDNRLLLSHPRQWKGVIDALEAVLKGLEFDVIAGVATGGISHAAVLAARLKKPMVYVRSKQKEHGKQNLIEGSLKPGQKVIVVEDLISTGGSSIGAAEALRREDAIVTDCTAIFTYELKASKDAFEKARIRLHTLTGFSALLEVAEGQGLITKEVCELCSNL